MSVNRSDRVSTRERRRRSGLLSRTRLFERIQISIGASEVDDAVHHQGDEKIAPMLNWRSVPTIGASRQLE